MATLYENYTTGDDQIMDIYGATWRAMAFTPSVAHAITKVRLLLFRTGSPGTVTVSIRATSGGLPTGADLTSGTIDGNTLTTSAFGAWYDIDLTQYNLSASVEYAIVVRATSGDASNILHWRRDSTGAYTGGGSSTSTDSGVSWAEAGGAKPDGVTVDYMFEEWGITIPTVTTDPATAVGQTTATLNGPLDDDGGEACDCSFEYGETTEYGTETATQSKTTGEAFSQEVRGLRPGGILYHFRAKATNSAGTSYGTDRTFRTAALSAEAHQALGKGYALGRHGL